MVRNLLAAAVALALTGNAHAAFISFTDPAVAYSFVVPTHVSSLNVLVMGGGGGGANGHQGGGGAGYLKVGTIGVTGGDTILVKVGAGGTGALARPDNTITGLTTGGISMFGNYLSANGGGVVAGVNMSGQHGSSGGGGACNAGSLGGAGGSGGSNGNPCGATWGGMPVGTGQGSYAALLSLFTENLITAGAGGAGGTGSHAGGGGAGGILVSGAGAGAANGSQSFSGKGGVGYGAGGGAGGYNGNFHPSTRFAGGNGANGLVYIEYVNAPIVEVPEPASFALMGLGILGVAAARRRRQQ